MQLNFVKTGLKFKFGVNPQFFSHELCLYITKFFRGTTSSPSLWDHISSHRLKQSRHNCILFLSPTTPSVYLDRSGIGSCNRVFKVAQYPGFLRLTNLEIHAGILFAFLICKQIVSFGGHQSFTVRILGDFPHFLSELPSNNQFAIKLVKMWPGGTPHVVVGTLKISLDRLTKKKKKHKKEFSRVLSCQ